MALTVVQAFNEFKSRLELNKSFQDKVATHHNAIREWIESFDPKIETKLIGSLQRKTRIQPRSNDTFDIDILVILGSFDRWAPLGRGITPGNALNRIEEIVSEHETYDKIGPETDSPSIIINYADNTKIELVPAYIDNIGYYPDGTPVFPKGRGYWVPQRNTWSLADYDYDAEYISKKNEKTNGYLIPAIKMLKAAKRNLFPEVKSYHLEVLAVKIIPEIIDRWESEGYKVSYPILVYSFFYICKDEVMNPVRIPNSKSPNADNYLTSYKKQQLAESFKNISDYCKSLLNLEGKQGIEGWRKLFGEPFPSYG